MTENRKKKFNGEGERMDLPEDKVRRVLKIAKEPISTETPIGDEEDTTLGDFIEDTSIDAPDIAAIEENLEGATDDILGSLTAREAKVLRMRFGIGMNTDRCSCQFQISSSKP